MSRNPPAEFDGYHKWLGIANRDRAPTHYELLAISRTEVDPEVIRAVAQQRRQFVETNRGKGHDAVVSEIVYRINEAELTLLNAELRHDYDRRLKLLEQRRKNPRNSDSSVTESTSVVGEELGIVKPFAGIVAVLCVAFAVMAWFSFQLPWNREISSKEDHGLAREAMPVDVAAAGLAPQPRPNEFVAVNPPEQDASSMALKAWQGEWVCIATEGGGKKFDEEYTRKEDRRIVIQEDRFTMSRNRGQRESYTGTFSIDARNGHFDFNGTGPDQAANHWLGIYELNGDELKLCYRKKGNDAVVRPTEFTTDQDSVNFGMSLIFRRVKP